MPQTEVLDVKTLKTEVPKEDTNQQVSEESVDTESIRPTEPAEGVETVKQPTEETPQKSFYTAEEMRNLDISEIDTSRIPAEMQPLYRSILAPVTRKQQELVNLEREYQQRLAQMGAGQQQQPRTYEEAFKSDPQGFMYTLDMEILNKEREKAKIEYVEPDNATNLGVEIVELKAIRKELENKGYEWSRQAMAINNLFRDTHTAIVENIPEYGKKANDWSKFAMRMGLSQNAISRITNPAIVGNKDDVVAVIKILADYYRKCNPQQDMKGQEDRIANRVFRAGAGLAVGAGADAGRTKAAKERMEKEQTVEAGADYLRVKKEEELKAKKQGD